jgi:hypothetical protein
MALIIEPERREIVHRYDLGPAGRGDSKIKSMNALSAPGQPPARDAGRLKTAAVHDAQRKADVRIDLSPERPQSPQLERPIRLAACM